MCGIFALFLNRPLTDADIRLGRAGTAALAHRGPDAKGEWIDQEAGVYLGHRRLSIIDPVPDSDQPMVDGAAALTFNGEIYNYPEIRETLAGRGETFRTRGDTEVLLRLLKREGAAGLARVDGMFAFAFWDGRVATLAADPFGEKPLFWAVTGDGVYVSSELAPLARLLNAERSLADETLAAFLALGYVPAPATAYIGIYRMPPAGVLQVERGTVGPLKRYWRPPQGEPGRGRVAPLPERDLDRIAATLAQSLSRRLRADVPLCLFLSRGVDSALVAALARHELNRDVNALTIAFPSDRIHSEEKEAARIAKHLGHTHEVIACRSGAAMTDAAAVLGMFGEPHDNLSVFAVRQMAASVAPRFKVALTGTGGDELFFGYNKHQFFWRFRHIFGLPGPVRAVLGLLARPFEDADQRAAQFSTVFAQERAMFYFANKNYPAGRWLTRVPGIAAFARELFEGAGRPEFAVPHYELEDVMPGSQLISMDLGSMRESLELRTPFLSTELAALIAEFDPRAFLDFGQKSVLRRILTRYLPDELAAAPKTGLVFPHSLFLDEAGAAQPHLPGLSENEISAAWRRRNVDAGWARLCARLVVADRFLRESTGPFSQRPPARLAV